MYNYKVGDEDEMFYLTHETKYTMDEFGEIVNDLYADWSDIILEPDMDEIRKMWEERDVYNHVQYIVWILVNRKNFKMLELQAWYC